MTKNVAGGVLLERLLVICWEMLMETSTCAECNKKKGFKSNSWWLPKKMSSIFLTPFTDWNGSTKGSSMCHYILKLKQDIILIHGLKSEWYSCAKEKKEKVSVSDSQSVSKFLLWRLFLKSKKKKKWLRVIVQKTPAAMEWKPEHAEEESWRFCWGDRREKEGLH